MRFLVEVSSLGKTDTQKFCVDAESWQRALQATRAQRGEDGPMSGFSIELLEEGYRAVDPLARVRFVVKRAPDDMALTPVLERPAAAAKGTPPIVPTVVSVPAVTAATASAAPSGSGDQTLPNLPPAPSSSSVSNGDGARVPRPLGQAAPAAAAPGAPSDGKKKAHTMVFASGGEAAVVDRPVERASPPAIGSPIPGLPAVKLLTSREQNPNETSPLTYREYAFAVPQGTTEEAAADVLRSQLQYVEAHIATAKMGKLVNLACFDIEFTGKPPKPPLATLTWKDWKGEAIVGFPGRGASKPPRPPSRVPASLEPGPPGALAQSAQVIVPQASPVPQVEMATVVIAPPPPPPPVWADQFPVQVHTAPHQQAAQPVFPAPAPSPVAVANPGAPAPSSQAYVPVRPPAPIIAEADPNRAPSQPPPANGMVKTPSGRFVRGRVTGDELITSLFESMHDLHFLRDALDGGQFCLALATEVLPARAAIIHFFDIEKREWVVACTRGKETQRLLTMRHPEGDEILREAARKRRALVVANAENANADRYRQIGGGRSLIVAPIMQAGRALGALEIINPLDGMPFTEDEGNAMTYIAEQFAEYLGSRGIVLDRERIQSAAARG